MTEKEFNKIAEGYFTISEMSSKDLPGSGLNVKKSALKKLVKARKKSGIPYVINSAFRTPAHNKKVGGKKDSEHLDGDGFDVQAITSHQKYRILKGLFYAGFKRVGYYKRFIHAGNSKTKDQEVLW